MSATSQFQSITGQDAAIGMLNLIVQNSSTTDSLHPILLSGSHVPLKLAGFVEEGMYWAGVQVSRELYWASSVDGSQAAFKFAAAPAEMPNTEKKC